MTTLFLLDARLFAYFFFTTLNALSSALFGDPLHCVLLYSMLAWRILLLIWLFWRHMENKEPSKSKGDDESSSSSSSRGLVLSKAERLLVAVPLLATPIYWIGVKAPHNWESNIWSSLVDGFMSAYVVTSGNDTDAADSCTTTILHMFANFYTASGFWKINGHFMDPTASCATVFLAQLLTYYGAIFLSPSTIAQIAQALQPWFPTITIVTELAMGIGLYVAICFAGGSKWRSRALLVAVGLVLAFHLAVLCLPPILVIPSSAAWYKVGRTVHRHAALVVATATLFVSYGTQNEFTPLNWDFGLFGVVAILEIWALIESQSMVDTSESKANPTRRSCRRPVWMCMASVAALFYSFGMITLGLMEEASPNMFANLKIHGGSNHWILPTGLLFHWAAARQAQGDTESFLVRHWGGGEIRLESTTSEWLTEIYPNDMTHVLEPTSTVVDLLQDYLNASSPAAYFNSGANRVLHLRERGFIPPPPHGQFIPYTVPALEWKRLLQEARTHKGSPSFEVVYVHLPGTVGNETWRALAWERRVYLQVVEGQVVTCSETRNVEQKDGSFPTPCGPNEIPYQLDSVPYWLSKLSMFHGYPVLRSSDGSLRSSISCFGP